MMRPDNKSANNPPKNERFNIMIRQLIIPGIIAGAAHAVVFFTSPDAPPPLPPEPPKEYVLGDLPPLPLIPPDDEQRNERTELPDIKALPVVFEALPRHVESAFTVPFNPIIALPNITGGALTMIPPGDYAEAGRRSLGRDASELFNAIDLDNKPRTLFQPAPDYPYVAKNEGVNGEVVVNFTVDENGDVHDVRVVRSSHAEFEAPTVRAVGKWRFEPGRKNGKKVRFRMSVPVTFTLSEA